MNPVVQAEDGSFPPDFPLSVCLDGATNPATFYVTRSFVPFTKAQVYLVRPDANTDLPSQVILKVYDPRFLDDRYPSSSRVPSRPWALHAESVAARKRVRVASGEVDDDFHIDLLYGDEEADPSLWEEHFFRLMKECFQSELEAYKRLDDLQGRSIPKFFGAGRLIPSPPDSRAIEPPAVLIEYIPGVSLHDIDPALVRPDLYEPLIAAVATFSKHGVFHDDINQNNILFTPAQAPNRAVLIDFGCAALRDAEEPDEEWDQAVQFANDVGRLMLSLEEKLGTKLDVDQAAAVPGA
ncbi:hypothetical protein EDC04DRAFT_393341 [Pisolithus marmoratus]|nr:hypothetical protein EDC04DRAFT_393341 [Pisolithus marmoratus]